MLPYLMSMSYLNLVMEANPEDVSEVVRLPEDASVTVVVLLDVGLIDAEIMVVIANEADDSVQAVADSSCGSEAAEAVHQDQGARVPQRL